MIPPSAEPLDSPPSMDSGQRARMKEYVERWKRVGPLLEAQREADVRQAEPTSGLVQQQLWFRKLHAS